MCIPDAVRTETDVPEAGDTEQGETANGGSIEDVAPNILTLLWTVGEMSEKKDECCPLP